jgi:PPK2 family polyphosphate:nucleotide phosphotransferase
MELTSAPDKFSLASYDPADTSGLDESACTRILDDNQPLIAQVQDRLFAEKKQALLIVLMAMDTGGKDPIVKDVLASVNPQACRITAFKKESSSEKRRDRLWRFHHEVPGEGELGVFNRSYYDEIVAGEAHGDLDAATLRSRYEQIRCFERILVEDRITILKLFLHISKDEQRHRLQERIDNPNRNWELSESDFTERQYWEGYMAAFQRAIHETHTKQTPWHVIPSDRKWFRDARASQLILETLQQMDPQYPPAEVDLDNIDWH